MGGEADGQAAACGRSCASGRARGGLLFIAGIGALASGDEEVGFSVLATALRAGWLAEAYGIWLMVRWAWLLGFGMAGVSALVAPVDTSDPATRALPLIPSGVFAAGLWWILDHLRRRSGSPVGAAPAGRSRGSAV